MRQRKNEIVDAEFTTVEETPAVAEQEAKPNTFPLDNVAQMVMVGRYKDGTEFVQPIGFDDALLAKAFLDYGIRYFDLVIDRSIYNRMKEQAEAKEQAKNEQG